MAGRPPADAVPLLSGHAINPRIPAPDNPLAWAWTNHDGGRAFFTTLGHPKDFAAEPLQRVVINALHWRLDRPVRDPWHGAFDMTVPYRGMV
jgi:hypothetical protein